MDIIKHLSVFNPAKVTAPIAVIGLGALGSAVSLQLAKLGLGNRLWLFDPDVVEPHNIANQVLYSSKDVGYHKAFAARRILSELSNSYPSFVVDKVSYKNQIRSSFAVFVCVDSMRERELLFDCSFCADVQYFVEGRMGARNGAAYIFNPSDQVQRDEYSQELYPDSDVVEDRAVCGTVQSVITTASMTAAHMVWLFISHVMDEKDTRNEILFNTSPPLLTSRRFHRSIESF